MAGFENKHDRRLSHQQLYLSLCLAVLCVIFLVYISVPDVQRRLHSLYSSKYETSSVQDWRKLSSNDPKPGTTIPTTMLPDVDGHRIQIKPTNDAGGILFVNSCTVCVEPTILAWQKLQASHPHRHLVIITNPGAQDQWRRFLKQHHMNRKFVAISDDKFVNVCNPFFRPRIYLFGKQNSLLYIQSASETITEALHHVNILLDDMDKQK